MIRFFDVYILVVYFVPKPIVSMTVQQCVVFCYALFYFIFICILFVQCDICITVVLTCSRCRWRGVHQV